MPIRINVFFFKHKFLKYYLINQKVYETYGFMQNFMLNSIFWLRFWF